MTCDHVDDLWPLILDEVISKPLKSGGQGELRQLPGFKITLDGAKEQFLLNERRKLSPIYASAELLWYLSREKSIEMIQAYAPQYDKFAEDGVAYGAYGARLKENAEEDLLDTAIAMLKERPDTKKCVIALWRPSDMLKVSHHKDMPCTLTWQFLMDDGKLDMICSMRSNDLWKGFLYDVYVNTVIHRYVAASAGLPTGNYHHMAGSMHLYERDVKKAFEAIHVKHVLGMHAYAPKHEHRWTNEQIAEAVEMEVLIRKGGGDSHHSKLPLVLLDAVRCCEAWHNDDRWRIHSTSLHLAMEQFLDNTRHA